MKQRLADYVADFLVKHGVRDCFSVVGGGAMHLNDALGHKEELHITYNHHEQACAIAAEAYARLKNRIAAVCVTTGPGATNAITGVLGGWMDSIPMLILSGQARFATTVYASGLKLRTRGVQEFDIIGSVSNMTKYAVLVTKPEQIRYCLEKAIYMAYQGRPGPCWLDIPLDIQGAWIETDSLAGYEVKDTNSRQLSDDVFRKIIQKLSSAQRPVLFAGNGIRLAGAHECFLRLVEKLNIPVVTGMSSVDAIDTEHSMYTGRAGTTGDRAGNFAVQNCDLLLSLGSRLSFFQTGFNYESWARAAYKIVNDIDPAELEKDSISADLKLCCNVKDLIEKMLDEPELPVFHNKKWVEQCKKWKAQYPVVMPKQYTGRQPNIYSFYHELTGKLEPGSLLVTSVGTSRVAGSQAAIIKPGMRFITNPSTAAMGYCLPAAIGVCVASKNKKTFLVTGEGSLQMNLQELQTIVHHNYPIIIFVMNNQGYHSIRMTQRSYFEEPLVGVGAESGDVSFPRLDKLAAAYGFAYMSCETQDSLVKCIEWGLSQEEPSICEIFLDIGQMTEPKAASRRLDNGQMVSAPLEDMAPFLSQEELLANMYIPLLEEYR